MLSGLKKVDSIVRVSSSSAYFLFSSSYHRILKSMNMCILDNGKLVVSSLEAASQEGKPHTYAKSGEPPQYSRVQRACERGPFTSV